MSKFNKNNNDSIDFLRIVQKKIETQGKQIEYCLQKIEAQEKEIYQLKKQRDDKTQEIQQLKQEISVLKKENSTTYQLATRSFRFVKALAYSTGRFISNSVFMEEPTEQMEYIREFDLKDPEQYPIGTYKARNGRLRNIVEHIKEKGTITTKEIVRKFRICHHTARADMRDLLDAFPNALQLIIPKQKGRESYKLMETCKLAWGLPIETL